jgi:hypothetical protein
MTIESLMPTDKAKISAYVPPLLKADVDRLCEVRNRSISNLVETLLREEVAKAKQSGELAP